MNATHDRVAAMLGSLARLQARADASQATIQEAAHKRLKGVDARMKELEPEVLTRHGAADEYQQLALERHRLGIVLSR